MQSARLHIPRNSDRHAPPMLGAVASANNLGVAQSRFPASRYSDDPVSVQVTLLKVTSCQKQKYPSPRKSPIHLTQRPPSINLGWGNSCLVYRRWPTVAKERL